MPTLPNNRTMLPVLLVLGGVVFSAANVLVLLITVKGSITVPLAMELYRLCAPCVVYFAIAPLVVALLNVLMLRQALDRASDISRTQATLHAPPPSSNAPAVSAAGNDPTAGAVQLLALLQREGRFLDFLAEDLTAYSDAQIGAAVRAIHAGCRKALEGRLELERVLPGEEGQEVVVPVSFDPEEIRLVGDVRGPAPYRGTLQHPGWRVRRIELPQAQVGSRRHILAPAEVEIPESLPQSRE